MKKRAFRRFRTRIFQWEFWPFFLLYLPVSIYYIWLAIRCRSFFFFTASNPSIHFGGMLGERKSEIFKLIPAKYLPEYALVRPGEAETAFSFAQTHGYPLIVKPDIGERGRLVEKIHSQIELQKYLKKCPVSFLIQDFVDLPVELGVFYVRTPGAAAGKVTSLVQKDFMQVTGNGRSSIRELLEQDPRALLQIDLEHPRFENLLKFVPAPKEKVIVEHIGNHCRGTTFLDQNFLIDDQLNHAFNQISSEINRFHFGRFDVRCQSIEDLKQLKNFKILELNGAGAEPGHIYQPGSSLLRGYHSIFWHLNVLAQISRINKRSGIAYWTFGRGLKELRTIRQYNQLIRDIK